MRSHCAAARLLVVVVVAALVACKAAAFSCRMQQGAAHGFCGLPYELSNFQGRYKCDPGVVVGRPTNWTQLAALVAAYPKVKANGVGHSWWSQMFCSGTNFSAINIVTTEMDGVAAASAAAPAGYTLPAFSWFIDQTIGGAVATGTHGSTLRHGSLSSQVAALTFMAANGTISRLTPASHTHLFRALAISVGRLGVLLRLSFNIVPNSDVLRHRTTISPQQLVTALQQLQGEYKAAGAAGSSQSSSSKGMWQVLEPWNEVQLLWFIPSRVVWNVSFTRQQPDPAAPQQQQPLVAAADVPWRDAASPSPQVVGPTPTTPPPPGAAANQTQEGPIPPPGAATNKTQVGVLPTTTTTPAAAAGAATNQTPEVPVRGAPGITTNPLQWSQMFMSELTPNVVDGLMPARSAYLTMSELENVMYAGFTAYDQYEGAVPFSKAGDCMAALVGALYGPQQLWSGFRSPALIRFVSAEPHYLSPSHDGPVMYINWEDDLVYAQGGAPNNPFQATMDILRSPVCGPARLHWGKARPAHFTCFDGAAEYGPNWCHFGCAVQQLDPTNKFAGVAGAAIWHWRAVSNSTQQPVAFASCCSSNGFDTQACSCARRPPCQA